MGRIVPPGNVAGDTHSARHPHGEAPIGGQRNAFPSYSSALYARGLEAEMYRDLARLTGRMVGVTYGEGIDVGRMLLA